MYKYSMLILLALSSLIQAQENVNIEQVGRLYNHWTFGQNLDVREKYVYVASGTSGLQIFDVSNPANPEIIGVWDDNHNDSYSVKVQGDYAYLLESYCFLTVVDVSNPRNPQPVGKYPLEGYFYDLDVAGDLAYVCRSGNPGELIILNVSQPDSIFEVGRQFTEYFVHAIVVDGSFAYMTGTCMTRGLEIMDISNPEEPDSVGWITTPRHGYGLDVQDNYAFYSSNNYHTFNVVNVENPEEPEIIGSLDTEVSAMGVDVSGNFAYVCFNGQLNIIDISNLQHPEVIGSAGDEDLLPLDVEVLDDYAYVVCRDGLMVVDVGDRHQPQVVGTHYAWGHVYSLDILGDYAYVIDIGCSSEWAEGCNTNQGLSVLNIANPASPVEVLVNHDIGHNTNVIIDSIYAYTGGQNEPLRTFDLSVPEEPEIVNVNGQLGRIYRFAIQDDFLYVAQGGDGLAILDISNPAVPRLLGSCEPRGIMMDVAVKGNYAYGAQHGYGMVVIDISDPQNPSLVAARNDTMFFQVAVFRNYAYFAGTDDIFIYDVSDPENPDLVSRFEFEYHYRDQCWGLNVCDDYLIAGNGRRGMSILDISDPTNPVETGYYNTPGAAGKTKIVEGFAYLADETNFGVYDCRAAMSINIPPNIVDAPFDILIVDEGDTLTFTLHAEDLNDDDITMEMIRSDLPDSAMFNDNGDGAGTFNWITQIGDAGFYHPLFVASDGMGADSVLVIIRVNEVNEAGYRYGAPAEFSIDKVYPNPFNSSTIISYTLPTQSPVVLQIYNTRGQLVDVLLDEVMAPGRHSVVWDGGNFCTGVYFVSMIDQSVRMNEAMQKIVLIN